MNRHMLRNSPRRKFYRKPYRRRRKDIRIRQKILKRKPVSYAKKKTLKFKSNHKNNLKK